ncbi:type VI secretion protein [Streptomyces sp. NPDC046215]|uniref:type VI secretion protein n=1 Tax=Streptomyces sp. NPDC046215 TaxID=3155774 RepID=UPI0033D42FCA
MARSRSIADERPERGNPDVLLLGGIVAVLVLTLLVWVTTGFAALLAHGSLPDGVTLGRTPAAMRHLATQPADMAAAWPATAPGALARPGLFWGILVSEILVFIVLAVFVIGTLLRWRAVRARRKEERLAARRASWEADRAAHADQAAHAGHEAAAPPPTAPPAVPQPPAAAAVPAPRAPVTPRVVYGADRGDTALRAVLEAAGPVLVTTSDPALWADTKDSRAKLGPVHVFDPGHLLDTPARLRWSPTTGCASRDTAAARATALLAPVRPLSALDSATADTAETLLRCWLHAAAVDGRPFRQVHRWAQGAAAHEPVRILRTHPKAAGGSAGELESALTGHPERRDMAQELTARALRALASLHVRDACNPNRADSLAWESFIAEGGTLYVMGEAIEDPRAAPGTMPLLTALVSSVVERGRGMAEGSSSGRLDPPLTFVLDDVAAVAPLPTLPELLTDGPDQGLPAYALMRSQEQARTRWPHRALTP